MVFLTNAPLVNGLTEYIKRNSISFHMPGHKGGRLLSEAFYANLPKYDLTEVPGLDNLHAPAGIIREAQELAARAFHSDACFFLVNGSTSGIHIMMMAALKSGDRVIIPRNCHKSVWGGLILSGARPIFLQPEYDGEKDLFTHVSPDNVHKAVQDHPDAAGMVLTNPDYYGLCPQLEAIGRILAERGMKLLVDEAHGAHMIFHPDLPPSAAYCGADLWVQSAHKTLPALTQASYLHYKAHNSRDKLLIERAVQLHRLLQSASPSYLLMASLDFARAYMEEHGKEALDNLLENLIWVRKELGALGIDTMEDYCRPEIYGSDKTRLVLDVSGLGLTGPEGEEYLRSAGIQAEMSDLHRIVLICSIADKQEDFLRLIDACKNMSREARLNKKNTGNYEWKLSISREIPKQMLSPKEALEKKKEFIPLSRGAGRICGEPVGIYPPGIPRFYPGELIDKDGVEELMEYRRKGCSLFGLTRDGNLSVIIDD
jgi:lysine decarboxylase